MTCLQASSLASQNGGAASSELRIPVSLSLTTATCESPHSASNDVIVVPPHVFFLHFMFWVFLEDSRINKVDCCLNGTWPLGKLYEIISQSQHSHCHWSWGFRSRARWRPRTVLGFCSFVLLLSQLEISPRLVVGTVWLGRKLGGGSWVLGDFGGDDLETSTRKQLPLDWFLGAFKPCKIMQVISGLSSVPRAPHVT